MKSLLVDQLAPDVQDAILQIISGPYGLGMNLHTMHGAAGKCDLVTSKFLAILGRGDFVECCGFREEDYDDGLEFRDTWHVCAFVDGFYIDLTRRQFDQFSDYPHVAKSDDEWRHSHIHVRPPGHQTITLQDGDFELKFYEDEDICGPR